VHKCVCVCVGVRGDKVSSPLSCKLSLMCTGLLLLCCTLSPQLLHLSHKSPASSLIRLQELCLARKDKKVRQAVDCGGKEGRGRGEGGEGRGRKGKEGGGRGRKGEEGGGRGRKGEEGGRGRKG